MGLFLFFFSFLVFLFYFLKLFSYMMHHEYLCGNDQGIKAYVSA